MLKLFKPNAYTLSIHMFYCILKSKRDKTGYQDMYIVYLIV